MTEPLFLNPTNSDLILFLITNAMKWPNPDLKKFMFKTLSKLLCLGDNERLT